MWSEGACCHHVDYERNGTTTVFAARIRRCVDKLVERHRGRQFLVFTHGGVLDILHRHASGKPLSVPRDFEIPNAALNWLEVADRGWSILVWADRDHLTEALDET